MVKSGGDVGQQVEIIEMSKYFLVRTGQEDKRYRLPLAEAVVGRDSMRDKKQTKMIKVRVGIPSTLEVRREVEGGGGRWMPVGLVGRTVRLSCAWNASRLSLYVNASTNMWLCLRNVLYARSLLFCVMVFDSRGRGLMNPAHV